MGVESKQKGRKNQKKKKLSQECHAVGLERVAAEGGAARRREAVKGWGVIT